MCGDEEDYQNYRYIVIQALQSLRCVGVQLMFWVRVIFKKNCNVFNMQFVMYLIYNYI